MKKEYGSASSFDKSWLSSRFSCLTVTSCWTLSCGPAGAKYDAALVERKHGMQTKLGVVRTSFHSIVGLELHDHICRRDYGCLFLSLSLLCPTILYRLHCSLPNGQLPTRCQLCCGSFAAQAKDLADVFTAVVETGRLTRSENRCLHLLTSKRSLVKVYGW